jgi:hypothetical protein
MAAHRNRLEANLIENNGWTNAAAGIVVRGATRELVFRDNLIRDTRPHEMRRQTVGVRIEAQAGPILLERNRIEADIPVDDQRGATR